MVNPFYTVLDTEDKKLIANQITDIQDAFSSTEFTAVLQIKGMRSDKSHFNHSFIIDESNDEFKKFLNDWGARRSAQLL